MSLFSFTCAAINAFLLDLYDIAMHLFAMLAFALLEYVFSAYACMLYWCNVTKQITNKYASSGGSEQRKREKNIK